MTQLGAKDSLHHDVAGTDILASQNKRFQEYRYKWTENPQKLEYGNFPLHLDIEVTSVCNLRCPFCKTTYSKFHIENGFITWETVKRVIDEGSDNGLYACKFNFRGEPLLHNGIGKFIEYAKKKGVVDVFFNTNAILLTEDKARMLIESGLDRLTVSCEAFEKDMYERYRVGGKFDDLVKNVEGLRNLRERLGSNSPKVRIQAVLTPELKPRFDEYIAFWKNKVDQVSYNDMLDNVPKRTKPVPSSWICPFPYQRLMIMWDGTVTTCYNDHYGKLALGNVHSKSLKECWKIELNNIRGLHKKGLAHELEACAECPLRINEMINRGELKPGKASE